ncbi:MAG: TetR/AcrR family transcriptional regulator [Alcanivorax sp.]|nr:TetR/AcrR family transcriptional regulator [Alcanivorax sp.]
MLPDSSRYASLRKVPRQPRAVRTVERIISATGTLLQRDGLAQITTNRVAEEANVNIASLYQYFPDKQALLSALLQRYRLDLARVLNDMLDSLGEASVEDSTRLWAQAAIGHYRQHSGLLGELLKHQNMLADLPEARDFEHHLMEAMRRFLMRQRSRLQVSDLDRAIFVIFHACTAILARHVMDPAPYYSDEDVVEELTCLIARYLY